MIATHKLLQRHIPLDPLIKNTLLLQIKHLQADSKLFPLPLELLDHIKLKKVMIPLVMELADKNYPCLTQICHHPGDSNRLGTVQPNRSATAGRQQEEKNQQDAGFHGGQQAHTERKRVVLR